MTEPQKVSKETKVLCCINSVLAAHVCKCVSQSDKEAGKQKSASFYGRGCCLIGGTHLNWSSQTQSAVSACLTEDVHRAADRRSLTAHEQGRPLRTRSQRQAGRQADSPLKSTTVLLG